MMSNDSIRCIRINLNIADSRDRKIFDLYNRQIHKSEFIKRLIENYGISLEQPIISSENVSNDNVQNDFLLKTIQQFSANLEKLQMQIQEQSVKLESQEDKISLMNLTNNDLSVNNKNTISNDKDEDVISVPVNKGFMDNILALGNTDKDANSYLSALNSSDSTDEG